MLEHPSTPRQEDRPSIWRTGVMQQLLSIPDLFRIVSIEQWQLGSKGVKPTSLLCANVRMTEAVAARSEFSKPRPQQALIGLDGGQFRTHAAKAYPTRLCRAMALALCVYRDCSSENAMSAVHSQMLREFEQVSAGIGGSMKPDYQPELV